MGACLLVAAGCSRGGEDHRPATLAVLERAVDVRPFKVVAFAAGVERQALNEGDAVRTGRPGFATITYFDRSLTRLDAGTEFTLTRLVSDGGHRRLRMRFDVGRTWNRVQKVVGKDDAFEVETPNAVASVRGTTFIVDCRVLPRCVFIVLDGVVHVAPKRVGQAAIDVRGGESLTVDGDAAGDIVPALGDDAWMAINRRLDAGEAFAAASATTTEAPTTTVAPTTTIGAPRATSAPRTTVASAARTAPTPGVQYFYGARNPNGTPLRWPCAPIHYRIYTGEGPAEAVPLLQDAFQRASAASGASFVYEGTTASKPEPGRDSSGDGFQLLVGFTRGSYFNGSTGFFGVETAPDENGNGPISHAQSMLNLDVSRPMNFTAGARSNWGWGVIAMAQAGRVLNVAQHTGPDQIFSQVNSPRITAAYGPDDIGLMRSNVC